MSKGKLYKMCIDKKETYCVHAPEYNPGTGITQDMHISFRDPMPNEINSALDDCKADLINRLKVVESNMNLLPSENRQQDDLKNLIYTATCFGVFEGWFKEWFGGVEGAE